MKNFIIFLSICMISNIYAQCDDYNLIQCNNDNNCEWVENITQESCYYTFNSYAECIANGCSWYSPGNYGYMGSHCYGSYQNDNSYCEEIEMPECSEMNELQCSNNNNCNWVEDIDSGNCSNLNSNECNSISDCDWVYDCIQMGWWYNWCYEYGYECTGGYYEEDNSYCEESATPPPPECSGMNELECNNNNCNWVEDIEIGNCSLFDNSESSCTSYSGECYWDEDITYSSCNGYDNSQWACNNAQGCYWDCYYGYCGCNGQEITGVDTECIGQYEIDSSYCEELSGDDGGLADPTIFLSIGNDIDISNRIIYIDMISEEEVGGFQFLLSDTPDNITITGAGGGITEESGFTISSSEAGIVVAFSFTGSTILPGEYNLFEYYFEINNEELTTLCIEDIVFSDPNGGAIEVDFAGCISSSFENMNMGDANGDGALDILDVVIIVDNIVTGGEYLQVTDMNDDGSIDVLDIIIIVGIILDS